MAIGARRVARMAIGAKRGHELAIGARGVPRMAIGAKKGGRIYIRATLYVTGNIVETW